MRDRWPGIDNDEVWSPPPYKIAAWVSMSAEFTRDVVGLADPFDRLLHPWKYPDRPSWPEFTLFPRLERAKATALMVRARLRNAVAALRGDWPDTDWDDK